MRSFVMKHRSLLVSLVLCLLPCLALAQSPSGSVENRTSAGKTVSSRLADTVATPARRHMGGQRRRGDDRATARKIQRGVASDLYGEGGVSTQMKVRKERTCQL